jgi:hypothetical protein
VKYADKLVLLAKEEMVLYSMTVRLVEIGRCYEREMNLEKTKVLATIPSADYDRSKTDG